MYESLFVGWWELEIFEKCVMFGFLVCLMGVNLESVL